MSSSLAEDTVVWIRFIYEPEIIVTSDREYHEISKIPAVILSSLTLLNTKVTQYKVNVKNKDQNTAVQLNNALQGDIRIVINGVTESARDHNRLKEEIRNFFVDNVVLNSQGIDEEYRIYISEESTQTTSLVGSEKHLSEFAMMIAKVVFWLGDLADKFIVKEFKVQGDLDVTF